MNYSNLTYFKLKTKLEEKHLLERINILKSIDNKNDRLNNLLNKYTEEYIFYDNNKSNIDKLNTLFKNINNYDNDDYLFLYLIKTYHFNINDFVNIDLSKYRNKKLKEIIKNNDNLIINNLDTKMKSMKYINYYTEKLLNERMGLSNLNRIKKLIKK